MSDSSDPILSIIIEDLVGLAPFAARREMSFVVQGTIISGSPISEPQYFDQLASWIKDAFKEASDLAWGHSKEAIAERAKGWDKVYFSSMGRDREEFYQAFGQMSQDQIRKRILQEQATTERYVNLAEGVVNRLKESLPLEEEASCEHVHLADVTIKGSDGMLNEARVWRVRISDISAWSFKLPQE